jgi:hypothetical protein
MPSATADKAGSERTAAYPVTKISIVALVLGWLVPGGGHFLLKRWWRGLLLMLSVTAMFVFGLLMKGKIYQANTGEILEMLAFIGDLGAGGLYIVTRMLGGGETAVNLATADYGTKFIIVAGLLNVISAIDAYHIAIGKKP